MQNPEIKFKCKHCGQEYSQDSFNIAVFLYGIFFLICNESGYAGITCPSCLKTITYEGGKNQIEFLRKSFSDFVYFGEKYQFSFNLRYFSSVNYFPENVKAHKDIDIPFWNMAPTGDLSILHSQIYSYQNDFNLYENYFCTYAFDDEPPMGSLLSVGWFKKDWIDDFIEIENEKSLRIFPRYVPSNSVYEDIEQFCWENHIYLNYLKEKEDKAEAGIKLDADPDIVPPEIMEHMRNQYIDDLKEKEFEIPTAFLSILVSDPSPVDLPFPNDAPLTSFWKTKNPFLDKQVPETLYNFDFTQYEKSQRGPSHDEKKALVKENSKKKFVQDFLYEHRLDFIKKYIEIAQEIDFSYATVWALKENYLTRLYDHTKRGVLSEKRYAFYNEGPGWRIVFDGKPISPLTSKGFKYIHFLVSNKNKEFTMDDLIDLDGVNPDGDGGNPDEDEVNPDEDEGNTDTRHKTSRFNSEINRLKLKRTATVDDKYIDDLEDKMKDLRKDIDEADRTKAKVRKEKKEEELRTTLDYYKKNIRYVGRTKKLRYFSDESIKNQRRIAKNIERSLNEIKKWNKDVYRHFHDALAPIDSHDKSYQPKKDIDWHTE